MSPQKYQKYKKEVLSLMGAIEEWKGGTEVRIDGRKIESYNTDQEIAKKLSITPEEVAEIRAIVFKEALIEYGVPKGASEMMKARFSRLFKSH